MLFCGTSWNSLNLKDEGLFLGSDYIQTLHPYNIYFMLGVYNPSSPSPLGCHSPGGAPRMADQAGRRGGGVRGSVFQSRSGKSALGIAWGSCVEKSWRWVEKCGEGVGLNKFHSSTTYIPQCQYFVCHLQKLPTVNISQRSKLQKWCFILPRGCRSSRLVPPPFRPLFFF